MKKAFNNQIVSRPAVVSERKEAAILEAMPGSSRQIHLLTKFPQATVTKHIQRLLLRNKAYLLEWVKVEGKQPVKIYAAGPKPEGYTVPPKSGETVSRETVPKPVTVHAKPKHNPPTCDVEEWDRMIDKQYSEGRLYRKPPDPIPVPHPLMSMYGMRPDLLQVNEKIVDAEENAK